MFSDLVLVVWSAAGVAWWIIAWWLVRADQRPKTALTLATSRRSLSIFKPLPPLNVHGLKAISAGLESFASQLDSECQLLLGVHEADRETVTPFVEWIRSQYPQAQVKAIFRSGPDEAANPKIAWQMHLAPFAIGELWLWSDADIVAPPGFLQAARDEFTRSGTTMLTFPYVVRQVPAPCAMLEALFVNAEFYPGVLLLRRSGPVDFGFGAAMLFERETFLKRIDWTELGASLADDFHLGQRLRPVQIGTIFLETVTNDRTWKDALQHDLRWIKTIRWNRPGGAFARILILPVLGWLIAVAAQPFHIFNWVGLLGMIQADVLAGAAICHGVGCRLKGRDLMVLEFWSVWRIIMWILSWMPGSVVWSGRAWRGPRMELVKST